MGCGSEREAFEFDGDLDRGVVLLHQVPGSIRTEFFVAVRRTFAGTTVVGGFSMTNPAPYGFGAWVQEHSRALDGSKLSLRHASLVAVVLVHEGAARCVRPPSGAEAHAAQHTLGRPQRGRGRGSMVALLSALRSARTVRA